LSAGAVGLIGWLAVIGFTGALIAGFLVTILGVTQHGSEEFGFIEAVWQVGIRMLDGVHFLQMKVGLFELLLLS